MIGNRRDNNLGVAIGNDMPPLLLAASHELKAPLALIRQLALALESEDNSPNEVARLSRQITLTSERALRLTTSLTKSSRLKDGLFELEPINPLPLLEEVAHELSPLYSALDRDIEVVKRSKPLLVVANRDLLRRVIMGFADNALHYSDDGAPVKLSMSQHGQMARIGVRDFGPRVPGDVWKKLKETLGSSPQPLHSRPSSSGLGLVVASQFADAMQGNIGVHRHSNGATFYVDVAVSTQLSLL